MDEPTSRIVQELNSNAEMWEQRVSACISEREARRMTKRAERSRRLAESIAAEAARRRGAPALGETAAEA
jgi:hypothetical protein